jgi:citrate/tricarballylate utilization protein
MPLEDLVREAERQLSICNACRYCEGYCAVFPALELRRSVTVADVGYLANLCHDCRACYYACPYTAPHEFAVNIPALMSEARVESYRRYTWPAVLGRLLAGGTLTVAGLTALALVLITGAIYLFAGPGLFQEHIGPGAFYRVVPYAAMVLPALGVSIYVLTVLALGAWRFWTDTGRSLPDLVHLPSLFAAAHDALRLRYLEGGGEGCFYPRERPSRARTILHSAVFYGFLTAFASTIVAAALQELFGILPPYALVSGPVVLGVLGGVAMIGGATGLILLKLSSDRRPAEAEALDLDYGFLLALDLASISGLLTLAFRSTPAMGSLLSFHLATLVALYLTAPYGKFAHFVYRYAALVRRRIEEREAPAARPG